MQAHEFCPHQGVVDEPTPPTLGHAVGDTRTRVRAGALFALALWGLYAVGAGLEGDFDPFVMGLSALVIGSSVGVVLATRQLRSDAFQKGLGSAFLLVVAFAIALAEQHSGVIHGVSWNALWVAFFPVMIACSPLSTLVSGLLAASMTPLAFFLMVVLPGHPMPEPMALASLFVPVYVGALMAHAASKVLKRVGAELTEAKSVGRYELRALLGKGGMGEVWEAEHRMLARPVAIKLVRGDANSEKQTRFEREARATASLESPHTVRLYDFGVTDSGEMFYVMERLRGLDLEALVREYGPMVPSRVVHVMKQALHSLSEAHSRGLVHRDIKPANLHLGRSGLEMDHLKVLDFGLVKPSAGHAEIGPTLTADGRITGTPAYLAPETVAGDREVDGRADVYALGCVAYFLLTGRRVFPGDDVLRVAVAHVTEDPVPPSEHVANLPLELESLILTCLEKDPVRRPFSDELIELLDGLDVRTWTQTEARRWWSERRSLLPSLPPAEPTAPTHPALRIQMLGHA
ncbi:MAG: protein kinase [Sandaracinaceae bacterium]